MFIQWTAGAFGVSWVGLGIGDDGALRCAATKNRAQDLAAPPSSITTELFLRWRTGSETALHEFLPLVYEELRRVARRHLQRERVAHTLQTTALIHEAYLRLIEQNPHNLQNRAHFVAITSNLMRQILVDYARERLAKKRDGGYRITLAEDVAVEETPEVNVLALEDALNRLSRLDPQQARVVELRYFGGLSIRETSDALGISEATVKREWVTARAWLHREIKNSEAI
jgi:RNA polymerase sigma factor (TIGR02999 family)